MKTTLKVFGIIVILGLLFYVIIIALYACGILGSDEPKSIELPQAKYELIIKVTGRPVYANEVSISPSSEPGKSIYYLPTGYWEIRGTKYVFVQRALSLDEAVFGTIELRGRN